MAPFCGAHAVISSLACYVHLLEHLIVCRMHSSGHLLELLLEILQIAILCS